MKMREKSINHQLNILRAGILGANDGIISVAGIVIGVANTTASTGIIFISGLAGLISSALSMIGGEYVSVRTQKGTEKSMIEKDILKMNNNGEVEELKELYIEKGSPSKLAADFSGEWIEKNAFKSHAEVELGIKLDDYANTWLASFSSMFSFSIGALLPLACILLFPPSTRIYFTFFIVLITLGLTGYISDSLGKTAKKPAIIRNIFVGMLTMFVTYIVGRLSGI
ncbi:VIT family protein [Carnobacterium maltaromaticum]|uniref:VIT1/CCC1 transporter family protein n=1 Tax=Carnobacterium maltaromaticum TaxID=2751 RepID=UPI00295EFE7E|nr:VIT family protein [Carnobacterium maltaromaticum]